MVEAYHIFHFQLDIGVNLIVGEHIALCQIATIFVKRIKGFTQ